MTGEAMDGGGFRLGMPLGVSSALHVVAFTALFIARPPAPLARAPVYRVELVAAPPGPRATGAVRPTPSPPQPRAATPAMTSAPVSAPTPERLIPRLSSRQARQAQVPAAAQDLPAPAAQPPAPVPPAAGGPVGGRGSDVANVRTEGIEFPFPGYLQNIVRQLALRFEPPSGGALRAEVFFIIRRDGSVADFRFLTRSGNYEFDLEAQGALEGAAAVRAFGRLPAGYPDDALPVVFSFDPRLIR